MWVKLTRRPGMFIFTRFIPGDRLKQPHYQWQGRKRSANPQISAAAAAAAAATAAETTEN